MTQSTRLVRLWQMDETHNAIRFCTMPPTSPIYEMVSMWLPRSFIEHVSRDKPLPCGWVPCNVELAAWKAEELGL